MFVTFLDLQSQGEFSTGTSRSFSILILCVPSFFTTCYEYFGSFLSDWIAMMRPVQSSTHSSSPDSPSSPDSMSDGDSFGYFIDPSEIDSGSLAITATKPHNEALYDVVDIDASKKLRSQDLSDELYRTYQPEMDNDDHHTRWTQSTPSGNLTLTAAVYKEYSSIVFGVKERERDDCNLERLHKVAKTIHADIHTGNVLLKLVDVRNGTVSLKFVDYGRSFSIMERINHTMRDVGWAEHFLSSSWELEGYEPAARDDIERAVQATADLMITWSYIETEQRMSFLLKKTLCLSK
jgi:hypothetical protein